MTTELPCPRCGVVSRKIEQAPHARAVAEAVFNRAQPRILKCPDCGEQFREREDDDE